MDGSLNRLRAGSPGDAVEVSTAFAELGRRKTRSPPKELGVVAWVRLFRISENCDKSRSSKSAPRFLEKRFPMRLPEITAILSFFEPSVTL
jgi:hypothetical protein